MPYVTSIERLGIKKGIEKGIEKGTLKNAREAVIDVLEARFEVVPKSMMNNIKKMDDTAVLKMLHEEAIIVGSLKEFKEIMDKALV